MSERNQKTQDIEYNDTVIKYGGRRGEVLHSIPRKYLEREYKDLERSYETEEEILKDFLSIILREQHVSTHQQLIDFIQKYETAIRNLYPKGPEGFHGTITSQIFTTEVFSLADRLGIWRWSNSCNVK